MQSNLILLYSSTGQVGNEIKSFSLPDLVNQPTSIFCKLLQSINAISIPEKMYTPSKSGGLWLNFTNRKLIPVVFIGKSEIWVFVFSYFFLSTGGFQFLPKSPFFVSILDSVDYPTDGIVRRRSYRGLQLIHTKVTHNSYTQSKIIV